MQVQSFFDSKTSTISHIVFDKIGGSAAIIDSVLDFDHKSGKIQTTSADQLLQFLNINQLGCEWILETHAHADHLSAAQYLKEKVGGKIAIGKHITQVQNIFKKIFNLDAAFKTDGSQFDYCFDEGECFKIGQLTVTVLVVPGHTPADIAYDIEGHLFAGDTLFMPDVGTARCDFPGGDAHQLYQSIQRLLSYPDNTRIYLCHDYPPIDREISFYTTVGEQKEKSIHINKNINENKFVAMRLARDATLEMPMLILPSIQINIRAGKFPQPEANGISYLKLPINGI